MMKFLRFYKLYRQRGYCFKLALEFAFIRTFTKGNTL